MLAYKVLKVILPHTTFMRRLKTRSLEDTMQALLNFKPSSISNPKIVNMVRKETRFERFFRSNYTPALEDMGCMSGVGEQKWNLEPYLQMR